ncbi:MAG: hypothetical protein ACRDH2_13940, partial [Anaerolineales bacterium]
MINIPTPRSLQPVAPHPRAAFWLAVNLATATLLIGVFALFLGLQAGSRPILSEAGLLLSMGLAAVASAWLIRQGRFTLGASLLLAQLLVIALGTQFLFAGFGVLLGVGSLIGAALVASLALYRRRSRRVILTGAAGGLLTILLDQMLYLPGFFERQMLPEEIRSAIPAVIGVMLIGYAIFMAQRFANYTLRTKLILTFLFVGLIPLSVLAFLNDLATRRTLTEAANQSLLTAASQTADRLDSFITSASRMVQIEALLPAFQ